MSINELEPQLANLRAYWHAYGRQDRGDDPELAYFVSGMPYPVLNGVTHSAAPAQELLPGLRDRLAAVPWAWQVSDLAPTGTAQTLLDLGGRAAGAMPVMALDVRRYRPLPAGDAPFRVERVPDGADLTDWVAAYGPPMGLREEDFPRLTELDAQRSYAPGALSRFVAVLDGRVVATTELLVAGGVAGVYLVATGEAHRRRGLATALVDAAVQHAIESRMPVVTLQASTAGAAVYARLGFETVSTITLIGFAPVDAATADG